MDDHYDMPHSMTLIICIIIHTYPGVCTEVRIRKRPDDPPLAWSSFSASTREIGPWYHDGNATFFCSMCLCPRVCVSWYDSTKDLCNMTDRQGREGIILSHM